MSKVALRLYNREIEALIDQGHIDEAVAHCQHILKTYPKHIDTYRLLGKAHLESHHYTDAADIFQRVLLAVPDDFVSHLGMSIVCDEQKDLDGAIWHMERAFEISSTNTGVQGELRRLRGRRDGMEPPKIQLTRGALAQIYAKGGEYQQAIAEIKAVLAEDESRSDMKALLARAYFRAGMRNEATEACIELLKQYPYSLEANRILVEILPGTSMAQGVDQYKRRIESLDPYLAMVSGSVFETDGIPDNAVTIERFEWDASAQPVASWNMPADAGDSNKPEEAPEASAEEIPDWMKQSGWGQSTGEFKEGPVNFDEPEPAAPAEGDQLAAAEIPDWLKAMAPPGAAASEQPLTLADEATETADLDWLAGLGAPEGETPAGQAVPPEAEQVSAAPPAGVEGSGNDLDWLDNLDAAVVPAAVTGLAADAGLDWLDNLTPPQDGQPAQPVEAPQPAAEALPDWLSDADGLQLPVSELASELPAAEPVEDGISGFGMPEAEVPADNQPLAEQPMVQRTPDWGGEVPEVQEPQAETPAESEPVPDWLQDHPGDEADEPLAEQPMVQRTPDWGGEVPEAQEIQAETPTESEPVPDWLKDNLDDESSQPLSELVSGPGTSEADQDEALNWLEGLAERQGAKSEELITDPAERSEAIPDWVSQVEEVPAEPKAQAPAEYVPEKPIEVEAEPMEGELSPLISGPGTTESEQDDAFKWLENLAAGQGAKSEELLTKPEERTENAPGWVGEVESPPTELSSLISGPGTSSSEQDDALLWLESLAQKQGANPEELITNPAERTENIPEWVGQVGQVPDQVIQPEPVQETPPQPVEEVKSPETPAHAADEDGFIPGPLSELVSGPGTTEAEQDDALLWLESLAQKQGAKPEELITSPDERKEVAPDWVAQVGQEPAVPDELPSVTEEAQSEESLAWLQGLAAEQSLEADQLEQPPVDAPQPVNQEWFKELGTDAADAEAGVAADQALGWLNDLAKPGEEIQPPSAEEQTEELLASPEPEPQEVESAVVGGETAEWLLSLEKNETPEQAEVLPWEQETPVESVPAEAAPEEQPQAEEQSTPAAAGITDWLKDLEAQEQPSVETPAAGSEELPDWLKDTSADEQPPAPQPVQGWMSTDETPVQPPAEVETPTSWLAPEETAIPAEFEAVRAEEVALPVDEAAFEELVPEPIVEMVSPPLPPRPVLRQTGMLGGDKDSLAVQRARDMLSHGGLDVAMSEYTKLIKKGKLLEEVIYDLQEAVYSHPVDVIVWQTLGDAYMRSNRLQEALDAYSKAEELLR
jgi:tetratricopeptide (TPR) repeat protein